MQIIERICDFCGGLIPDDVDCITNVYGQLSISGITTAFVSLDFCCTEHMTNWITANPTVATPNPLYATPIS